MFCARETLLKYQLLRRINRDADVRSK